MGFKQRRLILISDWMLCDIISVEIVLFNKKAINYVMLISGLIVLRRNSPYDRL